MAEISASLVKTLREKTGAGMMDCKKALNEVGGDLDAAVDWLRKKGLSAAAKKAGRVAAEGLVGVHAGGLKATLVEINAETDFVAKNPQFQEMVTKIVAIAAKGSQNVEELAAAPYGGESPTVADAITHLIAVIGENMNLRRLQHLSVNQGVVASYVHSAIAPNLGRIGVLIALESAAPVDKLEELGRKIAMHVAASSPQFLNAEDVSAQDLEKERQILTEQARLTGRDEDVIQKMVDGRINKYYEEFVLVEQIYALDGKTKIKDVLLQAGNELGAPITISGFVRFVLGEGIEKAESNFAEEVQAQAGLTK